MSESFSYNIEIKNLPELIAKLKASTAEKVIKKSLEQGGIVLAGWSAENRLTGPRPEFLGVVSNRLRSSIQNTKDSVSRAEEIRDGYQVRIGTNVKYARIHEFGGTINVTKKMRGFLHYKGIHLRKNTTNINIPARPFLRPALEDAGNQREVLNILLENLNKAINESK